MWLAKINDTLHLPLATGQRGTCPGCAAPVVSKCGDVLAWHWAHRAASSCSYESADHMILKALLAQPGGVEERANADRTRRADVWRDGLVFEIQISPMSARAALDRELDWSRSGDDVVWIVTPASRATMLGGARVVVIDIDHPTGTATVTCGGTSQAGVSVMGAGRWLCSRVLAVETKEALRVAHALRVELHAARAAVDDLIAKRRSVVEYWRSRATQAPPTTQAPPANAKARATCQAQALSEIKRITLGTRPAWLSDRYTSPDPAYHAARSVVDGGKRGDWYATTHQGAPPAAFVHWFNRFAPNLSMWLHPCGAVGVCRLWCGDSKTLPSVSAAIDYAFSRDSPLKSVNLSHTGHR